MSLQDTKILQGAKVVMLKGEKGDPTPPTDAQVIEALGEVGGQIVTPWMDTHGADVIDSWLDAHPEATTTVQDGSLTEPKFTDDLKKKTIKDYVTPEMFGAVGDGNTDDSLAIQRAINASDSVMLLNTYYVPSTINLKSNMQLFGKGKIKADDIIVLQGIDVTNVVIKDISIECNAILGDDPTIGWCCYFKDSSKISVSNCKISKIKTFAGLCFDACESIKAINNCIDTYVYGGIMCQNICKDVMVVNNVVTNCIAYASEHDVANTYPITVSGSNQTPPLLPSEDVVVVGNYIKNVVPHWEGIDAHGLINGVISNNVIVNCLTGVAVVGGGDIKNVTITNNVCVIENISDKINRAKNNSGIIIAGELNNEATNVVVTDNVIEGFGQSLIDSVVNDGNSSGIRTSYVRDCVIANNSIKNCGCCGMYIGAYSQYINIANNVLDNIVKRGTKLSWGIEIDSVYTFAKIINNLIISEVDTIDRCIVGSSASPSYTIARDNYFKGNITNKYFSYTHMICDIMPASPAGYNSVVGTVGDIVKLQSISNNVYGYICTSDGDGDSVKSTWQALTV